MLAEVEGGTAVIRVVTCIALDLNCKMVKPGVRHSGIFTSDFEFVGSPQSRVVSSCESSVTQCMLVRLVAQSANLVQMQVWVRDAGEQ
jgi:hypothetical protein